MLCPQRHADSRSHCRDVPEMVVVCVLVAARAPSFAIGRHDIDIDMYNNHLCESRRQRRREYKRGDKRAVNEGVLYVLCALMCLLVCVCICVIL